MKVMSPDARGSYSRQSTKEDLLESPNEHEDPWPHSQKDLTETAQPFGSWEGEDNEELMLIAPKHWTNNWGKLLRIVFTGFLVFVSVMIMSMFLYDILHPRAHPAGLAQLVNEKESFKSDKSYSQCSASPAEGKFDCWPEQRAITEKECLDRGCCWKKLEPDSAAPWCYFQHRQSFYTWNAPVNTSFGYRRSAKLRHDAQTFYPDPIQQIEMSVVFETEDTVRVKIFDPNNVRFQVPYFLKESNANSTSPLRENLKYIVEFTDSGVNVRRSVGEAPLFSISHSPLLFHDQFLELTTTLGTQYVYGLGESVDSLERSNNWSTSVLFNHDTVPSEKKNLYSSHPFLMAVNPYGGKTHGVFLSNSNAMEVILQKLNGGRDTAATFRSIGGIFDFRIFVGPRPSDVMKQYTDVIGKPAMPPYWSLGYHLCRFNYGTVNHTSEILEQNLKAGVAVEVQWNDLDYMNNNNDFTYDPVKFQGLPDFVRSLHERGMRYITLIDPGISESEPRGKYPPFDDGAKADVFVKNYKGDLFVGKVWNRKSTVWPDFSNPNTTHYWLRQLETFRKDIPIDGAWIDMNDPSNFLDGEKDHGCPAANKLDNPPYVPHVEGGKLYYKTLCMSAKQYGGNHYDLHNMYGFEETMTTYKVMSDLMSERSLIISRSSFPGSGAFGGSWTGDVVSTWEDMQKSIPQILSYGLFGIPFVGADICGFNGNATTDLCKRWQQLGAFYPFMRNHNTDTGVAQDPASMGQDVIDATKETLKVRLTLLPYLYSTFYNAYFNGDPVARPLFYEFPEDFNTYPIQNQFMLGPAIMVVPILLPNYEKPTIQAYVPKGAWYSYYTKEGRNSGGNLANLPIPKNGVPVLVRGGHILVEQTPAMTTRESRKKPFSVRAYLDDKLQASGMLYWDGGIKFDYVGGYYNHFKMSATNNQLMIDIVKAGYTDERMELGEVSVSGVRGAVTEVTLNNVGWNFTFIQKTRTLQLLNLNLTLTDGLQLVWKTEAQ